MASVDLCIANQCYSLPFLRCFFAVVVVVVIVLVLFLFILPEKS